MVDFDDLRSKARRRRETAKVLLDASLISRHADLEAALAAAIEHDSRHGGDYGPGTSRPLAAEIETLEAEIEAAQDTFVFESVGAARWYALLAEHPPTKEQKALGADRNPDTFLPAAIAASCVDPVMSDEDVAWLADALTAGEWAKLAYACCLANEGAGDRPKSSLASTILRLNAPSPEPQKSEASPEADSSAAHAEA